MCWYPRATGQTTALHTDVRPQPSLTLRAISDLFVHLCFFSASTCPIRRAPEPRRYLACEFLPPVSRSTHTFQRPCAHGCTVASLSRDTAGDKAEAASVHFLTDIASLVVGPPAVPRNVSHLGCAALSLGGCIGYSNAVDSCTHASGRACIDLTPALCDPTRLPVTRIGTKNDLIHAPRRRGSCASANHAQRRALCVYIDRPGSRGERQ